MQETQEITRTNAQQAGQTVRPDQPYVYPPRYEFRELSAEKVNRLVEAEHLGLPPQDHPMSLADIYNYHDSDYALKQRKMGFAGK